MSKYAAFWESVDSKDPSGHDSFWTPTMRKRVEQEVRTWNKMVDRLEKNPEVKYAPEKTSVEEVVRQIETKADFRRIVGYQSQKFTSPSKMQRYQSSVRKDAQKVTESGAIQALEKTRKQEQRKQDRETEQKLKRLYPNWDEMSTKQKAKARVDSDITRHTVKYKDVSLPWAYDEKLGEKGMHVRVQNYLDAAESAYSIYKGDPDTLIVDIVRAFEQQNLQALDDLLDMGYDEVDIAYLFDSPPNPNKKNYNPYQNIPREARLNKVRKFWKEMAEKYGVEY